jgi:hypothetical protein
VGVTLTATDGSLPTSAWLAALALLSGLAGAAAPSVVRRLRRRRPRWVNEHLRVVLDGEPSYEPVRAEGPSRSIQVVVQRDHADPVLEEARS